LTPILSSTSPVSLSHHPPPPELYTFPTRRSSDLEATQNIKVLDAAMDELGRITGQRPAMRRSRKSIAAFRLRQGMPIAATVTLRDRKSTRLNSSHVKISYAVFCLKKKKKHELVKT